MRDHQALSDLFGRPAKPKEYAIAELRWRAYAAGVKDGKLGEWDGDRFQLRLQSAYNDDHADSEAGLA